MLKTDIEHAIKLAHEYLEVNIITSVKIKASPTID